MKNLFLIRHGESSQNAGINFAEGLPDHLVYLTDNGVKQAQSAAVEFKRFLDGKKISTENSRIWVSPYTRTRQTCQEFNKVLNIADVREDITLVEHQYGLFDGVPEEEWKRLYPNEHANYMKWVSNGGKFYARFPCGESPYDVAIRIHQFLGTINRDDIKYNIDNLFVFTHGTTIRAFLLRMFHYTPEWFAAEQNPKNCWIRHITKEDGRYIDNGYILSK